MDEKNEADVLPLNARQVKTNPKWNASTNGWLNLDDILRKTEHPIFPEFLEYANTPSS